MKPFLLSFTSDFRKLRQQKAEYFDKTSLIEEMFRSRRDVTLITRPRRFGKSLTLSMLSEFFDIQKDSKDIFAELDISKNSTLCDEWMNKYPVVFISFKDIASKNFGYAQENLLKLMSETCLQHKYLLKSKHVDEELRRDIQSLIKRANDRPLLERSLLTLCSALKAHWGKSVIILIDEYDVLLSTAYKEGYYDEMTFLFRNLLGAALKDNPHLNFAILTGCLRIAKESIFTGVNNFICCDVSSDKFADKFGFTSKEVDALLSSANLSEKKSLIQEWYNGYRFGEKNEMYWPWDVLQYVDNLLENPNRQPAAYWANTSGNDIIRRLLEKSSMQIMDKIEILLKGNCISEKISEYLTYDSIFENERNIWSVLYHTGYLTSIGKNINNAKTTDLVIPNNEIRSIFVDIIATWFEDVASSSSASILDALWRADARQAEDALNALLCQSISFHDSAENFCHGFMAGLFRTQDLIVTSSRECGDGRSGIAVHDPKHARGMILELKCAGPKESLDRAAHAALSQIGTTRWDVELDLPRDAILRCGIAFRRKTCAVRTAAAPGDAAPGRPR